MSKTNRMVEGVDPGRAVFSTTSHPLRQAQKWGMPALYDWQREIMIRVAEAGSRVVVSTNNGSGKTNVLIPLFGLSVLTAFPGATVFSTAGAEEQIKGQLFKYLAAKVRPYQHLGWRVSESTLTVLPPKVNGLQSRWIARVPRDALTMEGYHGHWEQDDSGNLVWCPVAIILDESKSLGQPIFEAAWRIEPDFLLGVSTPGGDEGPFYEAVDPDTMDGGEVYNPDALWTYRREIARTDCPHLQTPAKIKYRDKLVEKFGAKSSFIRSFCDGKFQRDTDDNSVFTDADIDRARAAMKRDGPYKPGKKLAGLEFSSGGDEQPVMIIDGDKVVFEKVYREEDTDRLASAFIQNLNQFFVLPRDCCADNGGVGKAIIDNMEAKDYRGIVRYMNQQEPLNPHEYADRITEDHWCFKDILRSYPTLQIPNDPVLLKQMKQRRYRMNDHNKVKLEEKRAHRKRTGESPDRLDVIIMAFSNWIPPSGPPPEVPYYSELEEAARKASGKGVQAAFGWVTQQPSMFKR